MQIELMQHMTKNTTLITDLKNEYEKNRQRVESRIEDLGDKGRGRTESIIKLQQELNETNERIMKSKRAAANNTSLKDRFAQQEDPAGHSIDKEYVDEIDEDIKAMQQEINELKEQVGRLQRN